jgi:hypothetical protein
MIPVPVTCWISYLHWIQANAVIQIRPWIMTSSGLTQCLVICLKWWHNSYKPWSIFLHHHIVLGPCKHTIINPCTVAIMSKFTYWPIIYVKIKSVPVNWHSVKLSTHRPWHMQTLTTKTNSTKLSTAWDSTSCVATYFIEPNGSLQHSQELSTCPCPKPD